jgi:DNA-binding MarR family transcriptional regulator
MDDLPDRATCEQAATACMCFNMRKAARAITQLYDAALRPTGLKVTQFSLLNALHLAGPLPVTVLADVLGTERTTVTRNLGGLEERNLVRATQEGGDRRVRLVALTDDGVAALAGALPRWEEAQRRAVSALGGARWDALLPELAAISALPGRHGPRAGGAAPTDDLPEEARPDERRHNDGD